ncbi:MAG TPA: TIGR04282 family arsenosugar biosynthesis glycosyltransferase [Actinomycetota bacterium]|jgi:rSAM/selenodomain-associated transferase 1|nr:TIGR04282 family arsenosugar biosynthesis glycosyltransferase [Actinomycetota bacterium]
MRVDVVVLAKTPRPGRSKTRLHPPCTFVEAAELAEAALFDTLRAVDSMWIEGRRVLALDGPPPAWLSPHWDVVLQRGHGLDERLASVFEDLGGAALLVGMDTPQLTPALLEAATARLVDSDAVLGDAVDGGYWAIGLRRPNASAFLGVPMSAPTTAIRTRERLETLGLHVADLPRLRDVDTIDDASAVALEAPSTQFAVTFRAISPRLARRGRARRDEAVAAVSA